MVGSPLQFEGSVERAQQESKPPSVEKVATMVHPDAAHTQEMRMSSGQSGVKGAGSWPASLVSSMR
jgi:hypothetical protein